jgi:membrane protease YdiL (CAAX protease family)
MTDNPLLVAGMIAGTGVLVWLWRADFRAQRAGQPNPRAFPGAAGCSARLVMIAAIGAIGLLAIETGGEYAAGIVRQQKSMTALFAGYTLAAAFLEELIFRGYLVVPTRGPAVLWASIVGFSVGFALLHPFLWDTQGGSLALHFTTKAWFSTAMIFLGSLWFYAVRFNRLNPAQSLLPCFAAHLAKNLGVIAIKAAQGYLVGWW